MKAANQTPETEQETQLNGQTVQTTGPARLPQPVSPPPPPVRRSRRVVVVLIVLLVLAGAAFGIWKAFFSTPPPPDSVVLLSGRIEGDDSAVSPKTSGRILEIRFREGDSVTGGATIAVLDDQQVKAREDQARAALVAAEARARSAQD